MCLSLSRHSVHFFSTWSPICFIFILFTVYSLMLIPSLYSWFYSSPICFSSPPLSSSPHYSSTPSSLSPPASSIHSFFPFPLLLLSLDMWVCTQVASQSFIFTSGLLFVCVCVCVWMGVQASRKCSKSHIQISFHTAEGEKTWHSTLWEKKEERKRKRRQEWEG